jgi:hypothetical protein
VDAKPLDRAQLARMCDGCPEGENKKSGGLGERESSKHLPQTHALVHQRSLRRGVDQTLLSVKLSSSERGRGVERENR